MVTCGYCGKEVPQQEGKRRREYCDNGGVCKQLAYRKRKQADAPIKQPVNNEALQAAYTAMLAELVQLREKVESQTFTIELLKQTVQEYAGERDQMRRRATNLQIELKEAQDQLAAHQQEIGRLARESTNNENASETDQLIEDLQGQVADLRHKIEAEQNYLSDTKARYFKSWLKKQPSSPWRIRFLSDQLVPARGSHSLYRAHMNRLQMTEEEHEDFTKLWKLFLLER